MSTPPPPIRTSERLITSPTRARDHIFHHLRHSKAWIRLASSGAHPRTPCAESIPRTLSPQPRPLGSKHSEKQDDDSWKHSPCRKKTACFSCPRELRDDIFALVFNSTRLTFGFRYTPRHGERFIKPAPHSLALLRVCRQIHSETHDIWMKRVLFNFEDSQTMLNRLSELPESIVSKIRHLRLAGFPMMRYLKGFDDLMYRHDSVFQLLPALRLDCLTIVAVPPAASEYDAITNLINRGNGWKELRYITRSSRMLGFSPSRIHGSRDTGDIFRKPQPKAWAETIMKRDSEGSGASVQIYRSTEEKDCASILYPQRRQLVEQQFDESKLREFGLVDDDEMTKGAGAEKALLVLVKRGNNADISQRTGFSKERDMKARFKKRSWRHRKKVIIWTPLDQDKEDEDDMGNGWARPMIRPPQQAVDNYYDIDEM